MWLQQQRQAAAFALPHGYFAAVFAVFAVTALFDQSMISAAICALFFSTIIIWLLPWMPGSASLSQVGFTPAWRGRSSAPGGARRPCPAVRSAARTRP